MDKIKNLKKCKAAPAVSASNNKLVKLVENSSNILGNISNAMQIFPFPFEDFR